MQGDNNSWIDPWEPTPQEIQGRAIFFFPKVGALFNYLQSPAKMAIAVGVIFGYITLAGYVLAIRTGISRRRRLREQRMQKKEGLASWISW